LCPGDRYPAYEYYFFTVPGGELNLYSTISETACYSYTSPSSKYTWTESGTFIDTIPNAIAYDSIITVNLTIMSIDTLVNQTNGILTAVEPDATYQWLTCNTNNIINEATNQSYTSIVSGLYSVRIAKDGCVATSSCYSVVVTNLPKNNFKNSIELYPNPVENMLTIDFGRCFHNIRFEIKDMSGRNLASEVFNDQEVLNYNMENLTIGIYFISFKTDDEETIIKVIKK